MGPQNSSLTNLLGMPSDIYAFIIGACIVVCVLCFWMTLIRMLPMVWPGHTAVFCSPLYFLALLLFAPFSEECA